MARAAHTADRYSADHSAAQPPEMRIAIDTGGTFTDCVWLEGGELQTLKVFSTPDDPSRAITGALSKIREARSKIGEAKSKVREARSKTGAAEDTSEFRKKTGAGIRKRGAGDAV